MDKRRWEEAAQMLTESKFDYLVSFGSKPFTQFLIKIIRPFRLKVAPQISVR